MDFDQLQENLCQMERRCKASWDHLKVIAKHEMKPQLKQKMSDFLKECAERIIILKIVHRRIINRWCIPTVGSRSLLTFFRRCAKKKQEETRTLCLFPSGSTRSCCSSGTRPTA